MANQRMGHFDHPDKIERNMTCVLLMNPTFSRTAKVPRRFHDKTVA